MTRYVILKRTAGDVDMSFKKWQQTDVVMAEYFADLY